MSDTTNHPAGSDIRAAQGISLQRDMKFQLVVQRIHSDDPRVAGIKYQGVIYMDGIMVHRSTSEHMTPDEAIKNTRHDFGLKMRAALQQYN
jgi:hypothetical protein